MVWLWIGLGVLIGIPVLLTVVGALLPRAHVARMRITLGSAPERVWALVSDVGGTARWRSDIARVDVVEGTGGPVRFIETSRQGKVTYEVERQTPLSLQVVRIADERLPFGGTWTWELEPEGGGTRVTLTEAGFIKHPLFRAMAKLFFDPTTTMNTYLRALARELGEEAVPAEGRGE